MQVGQVLDSGQLPAPPLLLPLLPPLLPPLLLPLPPPLLLPLPPPLLLPLPPPLLLPLPLPLPLPPPLLLPLPPLLVPSALVPPSLVELESEPQPAIHAVPSASRPPSESGKRI
jgi:hypothetical protein